MTNRNVAALLILALLLLLTACGGGSTVDVPAGGDDPPAASEQDLATPAPSGQEPGTLQEWADDIVADPEPVLWRGLPAIPVDGEHTSSADSTDTDFVVLGKDALDFSQCEISGDAMIINPGGGAVGNPDGIPAWAMYRVSGLRDVTPLSLNVECWPADLGQQYSVAVADYTSMDWYWFGPTNLPELEADLTAEGHRFVTNLGNLYFLVVCGGLNTATHYKSTVVVEAGGGTQPPGAPTRLVASKGEFIDGVALTWQAGEGAEVYEVWRKGADVYGGYPGDPEGDPLPGADPDGGDPRNDPPPMPEDWLQIGSAEATEYFDAAVLPGLIYMYKVRAVNDAGVSAFSNIDEGWAFYEIPPPPPPPPHFQGIHGYVFGSYWRYEDDNGDPGTDPLPPGDPWPDLIPLAGATLTIALPDAEGMGGETIARTLSNEEGFYQFLGIEPGEYIITAELEDWFFPEIFWFEVIIVDNPQQFDFIGFPDDEIPWDPPEGIHGWVMDGRFLLGADPGDMPDPMPRLLPLEGVRITFSGRDTDQVELEVYTDEEGFYQVTEIAAGAYIVTAYLDGWYFDPPMHFVEVGERVPSVQLDFLGWMGDPPDPDPRVGIFGTAWGDADDALPAFMPLPGVTIMLSGYPEEILYGTAITDEQGQFGFPGLAPGGYLVSASLEGWEFIPPEFIIELNADAPLAIVDFWGYENAPGER